MTLSNPGLYRLIEQQPEAFVTRLGRVVEATSAEVYFINAETWRFLYANAAACENTGFTLAELYERTPLDITPPGRHDMVRQRMRELLSGEADEISVETVHQHRSGEEYPVELHCFRSVTEDSTIFVGIATHIENRGTRYQQAIAASEARMERALQAARMAFWDSDLRTNVTLIDSHIDSIRALAERGPIPNAQWREIVHPDDLQGVEAAWFDLVGDRIANYECDWRIRTDSGDWRWLRSRARVVERGVDGAPLLVAGVYLDIDEQKRAELALEEAEAELTSIIHDSQDAIVILDEESRIVRANPSAHSLMQRLYGRSLSSDERLLDYVRVHNLERFTKGIAGALRGETTTWAADIGVPPIGFYEVTGGPIRREGGVQRTYLVLRDTTDRKRMEELRAQTMRIESLGLLTGGIAHDFNNLLMAVSGNLDLATMVTSEHTVLECLEDARSAIRRAGALIEQLLAYAGQRTAPKGDVECAALVTETVRLLRKSIPVDVKLTLEADGKLAHIEADRTLLQQLLLNLIVNARDALQGEAGAITVSTSVESLDESVTGSSLVPMSRTEGEFVRISVTDTGSGMDTETQLRIFDPFFTTKPNGHGLGLASVLGTVRSHDGGLLLRSSPGHGTRFDVLLPLS